MPIIKSAMKQMRVSAKKRAANRATRSLTKSSITRAEKLIFAGDAEKAQPAVTKAISVLDKTVGKGVIHRNNAARRKSRLMKKLNAAKAPKA